jgi:hypothetical protein
MGRARYSVPSMRFCAPSMPSGGTGARTTLVFRRDQDERPTDEKPIGLLRRFAATSARITLAVQDRAFARPNAGLGYLRRITNASKSRQSRDSKGPDGSNLPPSATESGCCDNLRGTPPLWPVLSAQPNQRRTNIGVIRRCASVSLRAGTGWFGFAIASTERRGDPGCRCRGHKADIEMSRRPYG